MSNFRANVGKHRADNQQPSDNPNFVQGDLDQLETPDEVVDALIEGASHDLGYPFGVNVLEPACGTGRIVRRLTALGYEVEGRDIQTGDDFLALEDRNENRWVGSIITNPPYSRGRCDAFIRQALRLADKGVAMLVRSGTLWGERRATGLWKEVGFPDLVVIVPWRIFFIDARGRPISGQAYDHCWAVWQPRGGRGRAKPLVYVADAKGAVAQRAWLKKFPDRKVKDEGWKATRDIAS